MLYGLVANCLEVVIFVAGAAAMILVAYAAV